MTTPKVYISDTINDISNYYGDDLECIQGFSNIRDHLSNLSTQLHTGIENDHEFLYTEINNYHPQYLGVSASVLKSKGLTLTDCKNTIAHEYGYNGWLDIERLGNVKYHIQFEKAVNAIITGQHDVLKMLVEEDHSLIFQRSQYGHGATLLHYTASNGIELWRQRVPLNLPVITKYLLDQGADRHSTMKVYGGAFTTQELLNTSAHPKIAGIADEMMAIFT